MKKGWAIFLAVLAIGWLLTQCDTRTESEKWEDSYRGAYEEYAEFYGWD